MSRTLNEKSAGARVLRRSGAVTDLEPTYNMFAFEAAGAADFRLQGTTDFDTDELLQVRSDLRKSPVLRQAAFGFWEAMGKAEYETMTQEDYNFFHAHIARALAPELTEAEAQAAAAEDWLDDLNGAEEMTLDLFLEGLIGIADQWTDTIDELEYVVRA